jgi:hypothetical protein
MKAQTHHSLECCPGTVCAETGTMQAQKLRSLECCPGTVCAETGTMQAQTHHSLECCPGTVCAETGTMQAQTHRSLECCPSTLCAETGTMQARIIAAIGATVQAWKFRVAQLQSMMGVSDPAMREIEVAHMELLPRVVARLGTRQDTLRRLVAMHMASHA